MSGMSNTIRAYGYKRASSDMEALGAKHRIYIDYDSKRVERRHLIRDLREGDIVRVLYIRDLGGSPVADKKFARLIQEAGATLEEIRPEKRPGVMGRPVKIPKEGEARARARAAWLDPVETLEGRLQRCADILGGPISKQSLYRAFGTPEKPIKEPSD